MQVKMWDTEAGMCLRSFDSHTGNVTACCWLPDGQGFLTGSDDKCAPPFRSLTRVEKKRQNSYEEGSLQAVLVGVRAVLLQR